MTAVEIDEKAVLFAKAWWPWLADEWLVADITEMVEGRNEFDTIFCIEVLEHTSNPEQAVANMAALLKPGGTAWISVPNLEHDPNPLHVNKWDKISFEDLLDPYFDNILVKTRDSIMLAECSNAKP